ncbi:hypothetical protein CORC01_07231 [Colletotrichum orchidophilum]|uniref:Berberine/berberine-like domain-containing protein n=1 Tax=Colletotrichum orchidophilum TaxID=1209926 RepID=A0A1G4B7M8_9PEZI|nr:uncharacterized protein CORC01_07231 [Colletotrichum orchidophilum]OHE97449.1 hypothetical protein CORC01_07231 [Colletotrichum orchidophilum]
MTQHNATGISITHLFYTSLEVLRELDPNLLGCLNEANTFEPGWEASFFGVKYNRLRSLKARYHPNDLLWCPTCVDNEK